MPRRTRVAEDLADRLDTRRVAFELVETPRPRAQRRLPSMMIATCSGHVGSSRATAGSASAATARCGQIGLVGELAGASVGRTRGARATRPPGLPVPSAAPTRSTSPMWRSVVFWIDVEDACGVVVADLAVAFSSFFSCRRHRAGDCGSRPGPPPCACGPTLTRSRRRSSVRTGMFSRTTVPSTFGVSPMSLLSDRLLDGAEDAPIPGLDDDLVRLRNADPGQLVERRLGSVVVDVHPLDEAGRGATRADRPGNRAPWPRSARAILLVGSR